MSLSDRARERLYLYPLYAFLSLASLRLKLALTPSWLDGTLQAIHARLLEGTYTNNEQSRVLQFLVPEGIRRVSGLGLEDAYALQRLLFFAAAYAVFHEFLRSWFDARGAVAGVAIFAALVPFTHRNDLQESAPMLALCFVLGLWAVRSRRRFAFALVLLAGALDNETILVLPLAWFFVRAERPFSRAGGLAALEAGWLALPAFAAQGSIRWLTRHNPHLGDAYQWPDNLRGIAAGLSRAPLEWYRVPHLGFIFLFSVLWIYPLVAWKAQPHFLRRAFAVIPAFVAAHMLTGYMAEPRQMVPLGFLLVPMSLFAIFPADDK